MYVKLALAEHIRPNQPLPWDVLDESGNLLLTKGTVPVSQRQVDALIERGAYVDQDAFERHRKAVVPPPSARGATLFELWEDLQLRIGNLLRRNDREPDFINCLTPLSAELMDLAVRNLDAAIFHAMRMDKSSYAVTHSLQVAICADVFGHFLQMEPPIRSSLVNAALTMNMAILDLQQVLSRQAEPLTVQQRELMKMHPAMARDRLESMGVNDGVWLRAVAEHHETCDGKGYPRGTAEVAPEAEIINVLDRYCAIMSHRRDREGKAANVVSRELYLTSTGSLQAVVARVIKAFGLFPPGRFVRLTNGEIGIVLQRGEQANKPVVATLIGAQGAQLMDAIRRDSSDPRFAITHIVPDEDCAVHFDAVKLFGSKS